MPDFVVEQSRPHLQKHFKTDNAIEAYHNIFNSTFELRFIIQWIAVKVQAIDKKHAYQDDLSHLKEKKVLKMKTIKNYSLYFNIKMN